MAFNYGQLAVLLASWKVASLLCLPPGAWARFTPLRFLAYCVWYGMQPRQFLKGQRTAPGAPIPTVGGIVLNVVTGAVLLWLVPRLLPAGNPLGGPLLDRAGGSRASCSWSRGWTSVALIFRAMGFAVEKLWDCPVAATSLGDFWGRRWNRIVPGFLREVIFVPVARRAGARVALLAVFLYSGFYHELVSFMARSGYGGPFLYFLLQWLGVATENTRPGRRLLRGRAWLARAWTFAVVVLPVGLLLQPGLVNGYLVPMLTAGRRAGTGTLNHAVRSLKLIGNSGEPQFSASFDRQASATSSVSFRGLFPPKACNTVAFFFSFHRGATPS